MTIEVRPSGRACGAEVRGVGLAAPLTASEVAALREAWLEHHVLSFPDQHLNDDCLERFTLYFGPFGHDPYIEPIDGREHVIAVHRRADETKSVFAEAWHSDWSFQVRPPDGSCLYGIEIPPIGGDTLFANQHLALERMPPALRARIEGSTAIHSARFGYAPDSIYGQEDASDRAMRIVTSESARDTHPHPLVRPHPETGRLGLFSCLGYIVGIEGMDDGAAGELLREVYEWQTREEFVYRHRWEPHMLVMWDNRSVLHRATGGYEGHERLLHRTSIGATG